MDTNESTTPFGLRTVGKVGAVVLFGIAFFTVACPTIRKFLDDAPVTVAPEVSMVQVSAANYRAGQYAACVDLTTKALAIRKNWPDALNNRAICELQIGQHAQAEADAVAGLANHPSDGMKRLLTANLAWIRAEKRKAGK